MAQQNDTMLAADMNLLETESTNYKRSKAHFEDKINENFIDMNLPETESSIPISVIRGMFKSFTCNCRNELHAIFWLKRVEELDDEKLLECYKKFVSYKKEKKFMLSALGLRRFNMYCARLAVPK